MKKRRRFFKDYGHKRYANFLFYPLSERKKLAKRKKIFLILSFSFLIIGIGGLIFYLFFSPYFCFSDKNIKISGNKYTPSQEIKDYLKDKVFAAHIAGGNYWLFDSAETQKKLKDHFLFQKVKINTQFPHFLNINIQEEKPVFLFWCHNGDFLIDKKGRAFAIFPAQKKPLALVVKSCSQGKLYQTIFPPDQLSFCEQLLKICQKNHLPIVYLEKEKYKNIKFYLADGRYLYFNLNNKKEIKEEINKLNSFFANKNNFSQYADFRFGDRVYYK